jgi:hypothetical protein
MDERPRSKVLGPDKHHFSHSRRPPE